MIQGNLTFDGLNRTYRLFVPSSYAENPTPLLLALHGNGNDANQYASLTQLETKAEEEGFLLVFPQATNGIWNAGFSKKSVGVDDVGFLAALVDKLAADYPVDTDRVYSTGTSGGGMMTYRLACDAPELLAAIAPMSSTMTVTCAPDLPVSVLHIHGLADNTIPYEGNPAKEFPPLPEVAAQWSAFDGCNSTPTVTTEGPATISEWSNCDSGTIVRLYAVAGMGHEYPRENDGDAIDGADVSWAFLTTHGRDSGGSTTATVTVTKPGKGKGKVTSTPAGIKCGADCTETYETGTVVTLTVTPNDKSFFFGWTAGPCTGSSPTCTFTVSSDVTIEAKLKKN